MGSSGLADSLAASLAAARVLPRRHQMGPFRDRHSADNHLSPLRLLCNDSCPGTYTKQVRRLRRRCATDTFEMNESGLTIWRPYAHTFASFSSFATIPGAGHTRFRRRVRRILSSMQFRANNVARALRHTDKGLSAQSCGGGPAAWVGLSGPVSGLIACRSRFAAARGLAGRVATLGETAARSLSLRVSGLVLGNVAPSESRYPRRKGESSSSKKGTSCRNKPS